jgi:hypothetical protein
MSRYIDVDMLRTVTDNFRFHTGNYDYDSGFGDCVSRIESLMRNYSTADVAEVKHGQWLKHYQSGVTVSEGFVSSCCDMWNERKSNYCPRCGARMGGDTNDEM